MIKSSTDIINTYVQSCTVNSQDANNMIKLEGCIVGTGGQLIIDSNQAVNLNCVQNDTTQNSIDTSVRQNMRQIAEAITQQFGFPNVSIAQSFIDQSVILGGVITSSYYSTCGVKNITSNNPIACQGSTINGIVKINDIQTTAINCTLNATTQNAVYNKVISLLDQSSVAKQEATFLYAFYGILIFFAIVAYFIISLADSPLVQWAVVFIVFFFLLGSVIYAATAKTSGNAPFSKN